MCSSQVPVTDLLFGNDLVQSCKAIQETNKISSKVCGAEFVPGNRRQGGRGGFNRPAYDQRYAYRGRQQRAPSYRRGNFATSYGQRNRQFGGVTHDKPATATNPDTQSEKGSKYTVHLNTQIHVAGRLRHFVSNWKAITSDAWVLDAVSHCHIEFKEIPYQSRPPKAVEFSEDMSQSIDAELNALCDKGAIVNVNPCEGQFVSNIFLRPKKDGSMRTIINLKGLNEFIVYHHFKMETFEYALSLIRPNCYLASIDLKDAYFTIPMAEEHRKYLRFQWRNKLWQFTCLCFGLSSAPRIFTKVMKPATATLRNLGHISANYIDDSLLIGDTIMRTKCACSM